MKNQVTNSLSFVLFSFLMSLLIGDAKAQDQFAPQTIAPGSEQLFIERLHPYLHTYELHVFNGAQKTFAGTLIDELRIDKKKNIIERIQTLKRPNQPEHFDTVQAKLNSLAPLSHSSVNKNRTVSLAYNSDGVKGIFHSNGSSAIEIHEVFDNPLFDSNWIDLIIRIIPLKEGRQIILPTHKVTYNGGSDFLPYEVKVIKQAKLQMNGRKEEPVWIVSQDRYGGITTYYIKRNSLDLLKAKIPITPREYLIMTKSF